MGEAGNKNGRFVFSNDKITTKHDEYVKRIIRTHRHKAGEDQEPGRKLQFRRENRGSPHYRISSESSRGRQGLELGWYLSKEHPKTNQEAAGGWSPVRVVGCGGGEGLRLECDESDQVGLWGLLKRFRLFLQVR